MSLFNFYSWFFGPIKRQDAERHLTNYGRPGSFMVRVSESQSNAYSLSLRDNEAIRHYRIRTLDDGTGMFISKQFQFQTLQELVAFYCQDAYGLAFRLIDVRELYLACCP